MILLNLAMIVKQASQLHGNVIQGDHVRQGKTKLSFAVRI